MITSRTKVEILYADYFRKDWGELYSEIIEKAKDVIIDDLVKRGAIKIERCTPGNFPDYTVTFTVQCSVD